ncbi:four helix bundle protein [Luteibacter aegosomaticola]|uniref:four helix bundle protein n=1 Tax=Luteibacter aegosomaticola TaxID=2911538 RepID=UPI001FF93EA9|nr:four helix bundle protein [Luteibacter aegosomaticola]UPG89314.1 four helix bundle protein [Luteibacter aegosomaticola]
MSFVLPPVIKLAERMLADTELAVATFPRAHRYSFGNELRTQARAVYRVALDAWRYKATRARALANLVREVDNLKGELQIGQRIRAFRSLGQFEALFLVARDLGKQVGGWNRQFHPQGQNSPSTGQAKRSQILSTRPTSKREVNR